MPKLAEVFTLLPYEAAALLGVHRDTVTRWSDEGRLPCWKTPAGQRRYRLSDVHALIEAGLAEDVA
jgi:excisionase family DNA binding protein